MDASIDLGNLMKNFEVFDDVCIYVYIYIFFLFSFSYRGMIRSDNGVVQFESEVVERLELDIRVTIRGNGN